MAKSNKHDITQADFRLFVVLWNQRMNMRTPEIHFRMIDWMEHCWKTGKRNMLLMAFRSSGKSTLAGLFAAWLLYTRPDLRILVLAADQALAGKMVRNVKRIIERHPLTQRLKPDHDEKWASDRFTVRRHSVQRDPSMIARGITSNITGSRAEKMAELQAQEKSAGLAAINETIRAEVASGDSYVRRMRPTFGYLMAFTWAAQMFGIAYIIVLETEKSVFVLNAMGSLSAIWAVGLSVLGIYVYKRSEEKKLPVGALQGEAIFWNKLR